jgi:hypothetical protein
MKTIRLTKGKVAQVDECDLEFLNQWRWHAKPYSSKNPTNWYAARVKLIPRPTGGFDRVTVMMHNLIFGSLKTDHKDGNGLNNCRSNLRSANESQNQGNSKLRSDNKSGFKGVTKRRSSWIATIQFEGVQRIIGTYGSAETAARAYDREALIQWGEFAKTNQSLGLL